MKLIVNIEPKNNEFGIWSQDRFNIILDLIKPCDNSIIVLSEMALTVLVCCIPVDSENKLLNINDSSYKYVVNSDLEGIVFEYEDKFGFIRTLKLDVPEVKLEF